MTLGKAYRTEDKIEDKNVEHLIGNILNEIYFSFPIFPNVKTPHPKKKKKKKKRVKYSAGPRKEMDSTELSKIPRN